MKAHFRNSDTKRVPGRKRNLFLAHSRPATFFLLFELIALFMAKIPLLYAGSQVTLMPPFVGTHSETWEEFQIQGLPNGTSILGGIATISGPNMETAAPGVFECPDVRFLPSDGTKLMDSFYPSGSVTISFSQPISAFGAYWGTCHETSMILTFLDANGNQIGSDAFGYAGEGTLQWHGYAFATPVKTIIRKNYQHIGMCMDGLQATVASSVPLLYNISTRGFAQTGDNVIIGGLIISGSGPKKVLLRVLGPTLGQPPFNVPNAMANPTLNLFQGSALVASNDNWGNAANQQAIRDTGLAPPNALEAATLISLNPGSYTAIVRGLNNTSGNALFEAYDLDNTAGSKFSNISTRSVVQTGNDVMIAGVIVHGPGSKNVLIRALGPTLGQAPFNLPNSLPDPFLDLRDGSGTRITSNDNWKSTQQTQIQATGLAPPNDAESAIAITLAPGNYTAIVTGVKNATGNALVEVYGLN